jgi:hypothetical protein
MNLDPTIIRRQLENLKVSYPEILEDDEAWQMSLESETDLSALMTTIVRKIEDAKALAVGTKDRLEELEKRKARFEDRVEAMRQLAFKLMQAAQVNKLELAEATLSLRNGAQQIVGEADPTTLPDDFCKVSRTIDRTKIKEALKAGKEVPGFSLSNAAPSLSIRVK